MRFVHAKGFRNPKNIQRGRDEVGIVRARGLREAGNFWASSTMVRRTQCERQPFVLGEPAIGGGRGC